MKKKVVIAWCTFVVCLIATIVFRYLSDAQEVEYEEVEATVVSAVTKQLVNEKTHEHYDFYEVKVDYKGETYDLGNVYNTYSYPTGKKVTAYLSNGKLYANVEGVSSSTPLFMTYFVFLVASFIMFTVALCYSGKAHQERRSQR